MNINFLHSKFTKQQKIGQGAYGIVYRAQNIQTQQTVAIKKIKFDPKYGIPASAIRQISILKQLNHPNIIKQKLSNKSPQIIYLQNDKILGMIFQYMNFDLKSYLALHKNLTNQKVKLIMMQILKGLEYCHSKRIIHRDLKPQNILLNQNMQIKIADFGLSRTFSIPIKTLSKQIQTLWYRAPQILLGQKRYSLGVDMWAAGLILVQMIQGKPLFVGDSQIDQIFKIFEFFGTPGPNEWKNIQSIPYFKLTFPKFNKKEPKQVLKNFDNDGLSLLLKMLVLEPNKRISAREALKEPYFNI